MDLSSIRVAPEPRKPSKYRDNCGADAVTTMAHNFVSATHCALIPEDWRGRAVLSKATQNVPALRTLLS